MLQLALALTLFAQPAGALGSGESQALAEAGVLATRAVGLDGVVHRLGMNEGLKPIALVFLGTECPVSNRYAPGLGELSDAADEAGLEFYAVLSDPTLTVSEARKYREEYELRFPILFDRSGDLAHRLRPTHVPEAFVIDRSDRVAYRGRIDDRFAAVGQLKQTFSNHDFLEAIRSVADGEGPSVARTEPVGCLFESWDTEVTSEDVTYSRDIAPILSANCVECHRTGDVAPFPLQTYEDARKRSRMIAMVTSEGVMPPWKAERGFGHFRDERFLSERQIDLLSKWAEAGAPRGEATDELPPPPVPESRWRLGEPDLVVEMPVDYEVPAEGEDIYRYFVIPSELVEDRAITHVDFRPGNPAVVHHCLAYIDHSGWARKQDEASEEPGFSVWGNDLSGRMPTVTGWAPGTPPTSYPPGYALKLEGGGDFVMEVHYHLNGKATTDRSAMALYFADEPVEKWVDTIFVGTEDVVIEADDPAYARRVYMDVPADITLIDVLPHMHYIGRSVEAFASLPDGSRQPLIKIGAWDFRWQDIYVYREPLHLPAGTRIEAFFEYDNSALNPFNPNDPPARVTEGWQTTDEMCLLYMTIAVDDPSKRRAVRSASMQSFMRSANPWE